MDDYGYIMARARGSRECMVQGLGGAWRNRTRNLTHAQMPDISCLLRIWGICGEFANWGIWGHEC